MSHKALCTIFICLYVVLQKVQLSNVKEFFGDIIKSIDSQADRRLFKQYLQLKAIAAIYELGVGPARTGKILGVSDRATKSVDDDLLYLKYGVHSKVLVQPLLVGKDKILYYEVLN